LPQSVLEFFEPGFGRDLSDVRIHTGEGAERANRGLRSHAFTYGNHIWLGQGHSPAANALLAHELAHVVQQTGPREVSHPAPGAAAYQYAHPTISRYIPCDLANAYQRTGTPVIRRKVEGTGPIPGHAPAPAPASARAERLEVEIVGLDASVDEPLAVMANRWARASRGQVLRVSSVEDMTRQIEALVNAATCLGRLNVWYHGAPEIQLIVGEYPLGPTHRRLPASGFTREWLQLESNHAALTRFRHLFCCDVLMHWFGCGTATVRAGGGLRTPEELEREPALLGEHPDIYQSAEERADTAQRSPEPLSAE
jgi:hypothetical protein